MHLSAATTCNRPRSFLNEWDSLSPMPVMILMTAKVGVYHLVSEENLSSSGRGFTMRWYLSVNSWEHWSVANNVRTLLQSKHKTMQKSAWGSYVVCIILNDPRYISCLYPRTYSFSYAWTFQVRSSLDFFQQHSSWQKLIGSQPVARYWFYWLNAGKLVLGSKSFFWTRSFGLVTDLTDQIPRFV